MKRWMAWMLVLLLVFCTAQAESYDEWMMEKANVMLDDLQLLLEDEAFGKMFYSNYQLNDLRGRTFAAQPARVLVLRFTGDAEALRELPGSEGSALSGLPLRILTARILENVVTTAMGKLGLRALVFPTVSFIGESFPMPEGFEPAVLFIDTGAEVGAAMTLAPAGEAVVSANICFVPGELFALLDANDPLWEGLFTAEMLKTMDD